MSEKHYNIGYLEGTASVLKSLKESSYQPFLNIKQGTILDLGCGPGIDAINLARALGQDVNVIGIDHDAVMIGKAQTTSEGVSNLSFIHSEAHPIPFEDNSVDGARAERLLQHLKDPKQLVEEVSRVLKSSAPFVIVETDWSSLSFYNVDKEAERKLSSYLTNQKVNNGAVARQLTGYLKNTGFSDIRLDMYPFVVRSVSEIFTYLLIDQSLKEMLEKNYLSTEEYGQFLKNLEDADTNGYFTCTINLLITSAIKG